MYSGLVKILHHIGTAELITTLLVIATDADSRNDGDLVAVMLAGLGLGEA